MTQLRKAAEQARSLLLQESAGILSTHSQALPGYPFGSVAPYCLDLNGRPVILISTIAQHTKNIVSDNHVSLTVTQSGQVDVQAASRVTIMADADCVTQVQEKDVLRYYEFFPDSRNYHSTHDFDFYTLEPVKIRFIGGFGEIYWLEPGDVFIKSPFTHEQEYSMVVHMNEDHADTMRHYCAQAAIDISADCNPALAGIDGEGFHLRLDKRVERFDFDTPVVTAQDVRKALVALANRHVL